MGVKLNVKSSDIQKAIELLKLARLDSRRLSSLLAVSRLSQSSPSKIRRIDHVCCQKHPPSVDRVGHLITRAYVEDLTDAELLVRSVPGTNHIAWQLGHVISGSARDAGRLGRKAPALPEGFAAAYTRETAASDDPAKFATKAQYLALMDQMKAASLAAVEATPESELDSPGPEAMREYAPTIGTVLMLWAPTG